MGFRFESTVPINSVPTTPPIRSSSKVFLKVASNAPSPFCTHRTLPPRLPWPPRPPLPLHLPSTSYPVGKGSTTCGGTAAVTSAAVAVELLSMLNYVKVEDMRVKTTRNSSHIKLYFKSNSKSDFHIWPCFQKNGTYYLQLLIFYYNKKVD